MRGRTKNKFKKLLISFLQDKDGVTASEIARHMNIHKVMSTGIMAQEVGGVLRDKKEFPMIEKKRIKQKTYYYLKEGEWILDE